jgi:hypothetical protein
VGSKNRDDEVYGGFVGVLVIIHLRYSSRLVGYVFVGYIFVEYISVGYGFVEYIFVGYGFVGYGRELWFALSNLIHHCSVFGRRRQDRLSS